MNGVPVPVFVISLSSAAKRRARMQRLLGEQAVDARFVDAVDGQNLDPADHAFWQGNAGRAALNPGEIGCLLSHRVVWQTMVAEGIERAVLLEDDLCISPRFATVLSALGALPQEIALLRLESDRREVIVRRATAANVGGHSCHLMRRGGPVGTGAYTLTRAMAERLLAAMPNFAAPIDAELFAARRSSMPDLVAHQLIPPVCMQAQFDPALKAREPYLASMIADMGERADQRMGIAGPAKTKLLTRKPAWLIVLRGLLRSVMLAPGGWRRLKVYRLD